MNTLDYKIKMFENIILVIPFIIIVFVKVFKNSGVFLFLVYTFAFPFILPIIVLFFLQKLLKLPVVLVKMLMSKNLFLINTLTFFVFLILFFLSSQVTYKCFFSTGLVLLLLVFILQLLRWSVDPFSIPYLYGNIFLVIIKKVIYFIYIPQKWEKTINVKDLDEKIKYFKECADDIDTKSKGYDAFLNREYSLTNIMPLFIIEFIFLICIISIIFATNIFYIDRVISFNFKGLNAGSSIFDYFYLAICGVLGSIPSEIQPITRYGKLYIIVLTILGVLLLTIFISMLFNSISSKNTPSLQKMKEVPIRLKNGISKLIEQLEIIKNNSNKS